MGLLKFFRKLFRKPKLNENPTMEDCFFHEELIRKRRQVNREAYDIVLKSLRSLNSTSAYVTYMDNQERQNRILSIG